jgi:hypothetical protein
MKCTPAFEKRMQRIIRSIFYYGFHGGVLLAIAVGAYFDPDVRFGVIFTTSAVAIIAAFVAVSLWCMGEINFCKDDKTG